MSNEINNINLFEILNKVPIGILSINEKFEINFINENFIRFGLIKNGEADNLTGKNIFEIELFSNSLIKKEINSLHTGNIFEREVKNYKTLGGSKISLLIKASPLFENENFKGALIVLEDIRILEDLSRDEFLRKDYFEDILHNFFDYVFFLDKVGIIKYLTGGGNINLISNPRALINTSIKEFHLKNYVAEFQKSIESCIKSNSINKYNASFNFTEDEKYFSVTMIPLLNHRQEVQFISLILKDITGKIREKQKFEQEMFELRQYQVITETITDAVIAVEMNGNIVFWNKSSQVLFGYTKSEVYGKFIGKILKSFDSTYFKGILEEIQNTTFWQSDLKTYKKNGELQIVQAKFAISKQNGNSSVIILCSNVTERAIVEKELRLSEERFRNIITNATEFICNIEPDGTFSYANPAFMKAVGYDETELFNKKLIELIDNEYLKSNSFSLKNYKKPGQKPIELPVISKSGNKLILLAHFTPVFSVDNNLKNFSGIFTDITEKKQAEKDLMITRSVFDASLDGIAVECNRKYILVNDSFAKIFGYENGEEVVGKEPLDLVDNEDIPRIANYTKARESGANAPNRYEFLGKRKDNTKFFVESSVTSFKADNNIYIISVVRDVTERKRVQQAIKESEEKYRSITENIDDYLWTAERINNKLRTVFYTSSVEKMTGITQSEFLRDSRLFFRIIYPDDFPFVKDKLKRLYKSKYKKSDEIEFRIINSNGNIVWIRNKINIVRDNAGVIQKVYGLVSDISLRKKAEEELKNSADNLLKLNQTKDKFLSIISHDLRTPFSSILGFTEMLLTNDRLSAEDQKKYIGFIHESSGNMLELLNSLLDWTRLQTGRIEFEPAKIEAKEIIETSFSTLNGSAFKKDIKLINKVEGDIFLFVDKSLIVQALNNLISNAIKFTGNDGSITVGWKQTENKRFCELSIKDTGVGIKEENLDKLFSIESKFTQEGTAGEKGTGLGLSLVKEIVERHGGKIRLESKYGKGTTFYITLPLASSLILYVEDSNTDRVLYVKLLKSIVPEYDIETAANGIEAFEKVAKLSPALIITDHTMPKMNGYELVNKIKNSDIKGMPPVIILSSDVTKELTQDYTELGVEYILKKPVILSSLKDAIEKSVKSSISKK